MMRLRHLRLFEMELYWEYEPLNESLTFPQIYLSLNRFSVAVRFLLRSFGVVYSQIQNKNLPPLEFLLDLYREPNLFQVNCDKGTESLSFVSNKMMSRFFSCGINVQLSTLQNLEVLIFSTSKVLGYTKSIFIFYYVHLHIVKQNFNELHLYKSMWHVFICNNYTL